MGTRGAYGFRFNGMDKMSYNHFDSYPSCLGDEIVKFIMSHKVEDMKEFFNAIVLVDEEGNAPADVAKQYKAASDFGVGTGSAQDWYCVLRGIQGDLAGLYKFYKAGVVPYMIDNHEFIEDSLFCEYAYIINLDDETLEFYIGFQKEPQPGNRYGEEAYNGCYPCALKAVYPLSCADDMLSSMEAYNENTTYRDEYAFENDEAAEEDMMDKIIKAAESTGWSCTFGNSCVSFSSYSPQGEDLDLEFDYKDIDDLVYDLRENYDSFDITEHVYDWLCARFQSGVSTPDAEELVEDAKEIWSMYKQLLYAIEELAS